MYRCKVSIDATYEVSTESPDDAKEVAIDRFQSNYNDFGVYQAPKGGWRMDDFFFFAF